MDTGASDVAALPTGRRFVGIELDLQHFKHACERINDAHRQCVLAAHDSRGPEQSALDV